MTGWGYETTEHLGPLHGRGPFLDRRRQRAERAAAMAEVDRWLASWRSPATGAEWAAGEARPIERADASRAVVWAVVPEPEVPAALRLAAARGVRAAEEELRARGEGGLPAYGLRFARRCAPGEAVPAESMPFAASIAGLTFRAADGGIRVWISGHEPADFVEEVVVPHELRHVMQLAGRVRVADAEREPDAERFATACERRLFGGTTRAERERSRRAVREQRVREAERRRLLGPAWVGCGSAAG